MRFRSDLGNVRVTATATTTATATAAATRRIGISPKRFVVCLVLLIFIYTLEFDSFLVSSSESPAQASNATLSSADTVTGDMGRRQEASSEGTSEDLQLYQRDFDDESDEEEGGSESKQFSSPSNTSNVDAGTHNLTRSGEEKMIEDHGRSLGSEEGTRDGKSGSVAGRSQTERRDASIEKEIEIIKSKLMNSTFKLDDFYARTVFDRLFEMFEPASEKTLDFLEINRNLTRIIDTSKSNSNVGDSYGVLAYLWFYGVPNKSGKLEFPNGWPRNIDIALRYALKGATKFNCGFCYTMMGLLFAWGYPPIVNNTHGWIGMDNSSSKLDMLKSSTSKNTYFLYHSPHKYSNNMDPETLNFPAEKSGFDLVSMNYALASKNKDIFGQLASSYYLRYSLSDISYRYNLLENSSAFSLHRIPRNLTSIVGVSSFSSSRCIVALEPLIFVASRTLSDSRDIFLPDISTLLRENKQKEHDTKHYAEWVKSLAADRDPEGMTSLGELYYYGHEAGGIARDVNRAAQLWEESARRGDPQGALARAFLNLDGTMGTERDSGPYLRQVARYGEPPVAALANYYIYKLGLDVDKNSTIAGEYLKLAADLGDGNAQLILAHAYAGGKMGVVPPGGQNDTLALKYYKLSAEGGRTVSYFNSAVLTLKGSDSKYKTEESRCIASIDYLTHVVKKNNHVKLLSLMSKKAYESGDMVGSLLREMTLSEMGFIEGHINSQDLWKEKAVLYYNNAIKKMGRDHDIERAPVCEVPEGEEGGRMTSRESYVNLLGMLVKQLERLISCEVTVLDESNERFSTQYPNEFEMEMSGFSSKSFCLVRASRKDIFFSVPVNFDSTIIYLKSKYFKYYDMFNMQNATLRGNLDMSYSRSLPSGERSRVSEFLNCWMRPMSYYHEEERARRSTFGFGGEDGDGKTGFGDLEDFWDDEEGSVFDRLLELWQRPKHGSYNRYPRPWYRVFGHVIKALRYVYSSALIASLVDWGRRYFGENGLGWRWGVGSRGPYSSGSLFDLDQDLEIDEERVPEIIRLRRNSSLWCSHYYARRSSSNGDISSTQSLVQQFLEGSFGVEKDPVSAFELILQGVNSRDPKSILDYAIALNKGIGVRKDKPKSYRLLWHLIARGPFNIEDILPRPPSGPKFTPSILDNIRDALIPLKNNTNSTKTVGAFSSSNGTVRILNIDNETTTSSLDQDQEQDGGDLDQSGSKEESKHRKGRRARMNDAINMNYKTQQDLATRISSFNILMILTLDWIYYNIFLRHYYSSVALKNQVLSAFSALYSKQASTEDLTGKDGKVGLYSGESSSNSSSSQVAEGEVFLGLDKSQIQSADLPLDTYNHSVVCTHHGRVVSELYCSTMLGQETAVCKDPKAILAESWRREGELLKTGDDGDKRTDEMLEKDLILMIDEDPFPLSSKFRYVSDEEYNKASNIWKASISIRLYYFVLRIIIIVGIISVLIPLNIAITEKTSEQVQQ